MTRRHLRKPRVIETKAAPADLPKLLRAVDGVELWQESPTGRDRKIGRLTYFVKTPVGTRRTFDKPHEAWRYFQKLTGISNVNPVVGPTLPQ
jgi:hypothetical protein